MVKGTRGHVLVAGGRRRGELLRGTALQAASLLALAVPAAAQPAPGAQPQGGRVVAGAASIAQTATATTVSQSSQRAAVTWGSFDVGRDQSVTFQQPSASAVTLNSVTGGTDPSAIAGKISANGQIIITNQNGVVFYPGAEVNAQGVVVSAAGIGNRNFMAGRMTFDRPAHPNARVVNQGSITVKQAGLAALVAPQVANSGTITARMGHVVLAGAETHTLDLYGDGLLSLDVTGKVRQVPRGPDGKPVTALVTNTGTVIADGGTVTLTAAAADGIVQDLVSAGGRIRANTVGGQPGSVVIAGTGGSVSVAGRVSADGTAPGESGGTVVVNATGTVTAASGARISASGAAGGGTVALGTTLARATGGAGVTGQPTAARTIVQRGARIAANARRRGNGGRVTILSAGQTTLAGKAAARGGRQGGDGGTVEVSGNTLGLTGTITAAAPQGSAGTILLDPTNLTIAASGGNITPTAGDPNIALTAQPADAVVTATALQSLQGTVHLQATDTVTVAASVTFTSAQSALWLDGQNRIVVNAGTTITLPGTGNRPGEIRLTSGAGGAQLLGSLNTGTIQFETPGAVTQGPSSAVIAADLWGNAGSVALTSRLNQVAAIGQGNASVPGGGGHFVTTAGDFSLTTASVDLAVGNDFQGNGISVPAGHTIALVTDGITVAVAGSATAPLDAANGTVSIAPFTAGRPVEIVGQSKTPGALSLSTQDLYGIGAGTLVLGSASAGPLTVGADGGYIYNAPSTLSLQSGSSIGQAGGLSVGTLVASAPTINLPSANNSIGALGGATASGDIAVTSGGPMLVAGPVSGANVSLTTYGDLTLAADVTAPGTLTLAANPLMLEGALPPNGSGGSTNQGAITQSAGTVTAGTLVATAGSDIALPSATNAISHAGDIVAGGNLSLSNGPQLLAVTGTLAAGPSSTLSISTAGNLALAATSTLTSDTQVSLAASGAITQAQGSSIATPVLVGSAASASLVSTANQVGALLGFSTTAGGFALTDGTALTVGPESGVSVPSGQAIALVADQLTLAASLSAPGGTVALAPLTAGRPVELIASGTGDPNALSLRQGDLGQITAATLQLGSLGAGPITLGNPGDVIALATVGTLDLLSGGAVTEPGGITVGTLEGHAQSASLGGNNAVGVLAEFTTQGGFSLADGRALTVAGPVAGGASVALNVTGGLALDGSLSTPGTVTFDATGAVTQPGGGIGAGTLTGRAASATLLGSNGIRALGSVTTQGGFALADLIPLIVAGAVVDNTGIALSAPSLVISETLSAPTITLTASAAGGILQTSGSLVTGLLSGSAGGAVSLGQTGNQVARLGAFTGGSDVLIADSVPLAVAGAVSAGGSAPTLTITDDAPTLASGGSLTALGGTVALRPVTLGDALVLAHGGVLGIAAPITASTLAVGDPETGPITISAAFDLGKIGTLDLQSGGAITETGGGAVAVGTLTGKAASASLSGPNEIGTLAGFSTGGGFALTDAGGLAVTGALSGGPLALAVHGNLVLAAGVSGGAVTLGATGAISQPAGTLTTGALGGAATSADFGQANQVSGLGAFTARDGLTLSTAGDLSVNGPVAAGTLTLTTGGGLRFTGPVNAGALLVNAGGSVTQPAGTLTVGTLSGSAAGPAQFGSSGAAADIAALGAFTVANGSLGVQDGRALTISGPLSAADIAIAAPGSVTLAGGTITTDGLPLAQQAGALPASPGSYVQVLAGPDGTGTLTQTGTTTVLPLGGGTATLRLGLPAGGGTLTLNDLAAGTADIVLATGAGGTATGTIDANNLLVIGQGGSASLSGTVQGQGGATAAEISRIGQFSTLYQLNGCPIQAASCLPPAPPEPVVDLQEENVDGSLIQPMKDRVRPELLTLDPFPLMLGVVQNMDDPDFLLPNVSDRDY